MNHSWRKGIGRSALAAVLVVTLLGVATGSALAAEGDRGWGRMVFAPYTDACQWPTPNLTEGQDVGVKHYVMAFIVTTPGSTTPCWGGYGVYDLTHMKAQVDALRARGGEVMVSIGGEANCPLAGTITDVDELCGWYKKIIDAYDLTLLDFDIEGTWVGDTASIERRSQALVKLQQDPKYAKVRIWYTLPTNPTGLDSRGRNVVDSALAHGVNLTGVNVMAMCWGGGFLPPDGSPADMGALAIQSGEALHTQLRALYQKHNIAKTDDQLWAMVGVTPMIGKNYSDLKVFGLEDARELVAWGLQKNVGLLSFWAITRDFDNGGDLVKGSGVTQEPYEFSSIFAQFEGDPGENRPPYASDDDAKTTVDEAVTVDVLANDSDANGDPLTVTAVTSPAHGTAAIGDNKVVYTPASGYTGTDAFEYTVSDGQGGESKAAVSVVIRDPSGNAPPEAADDEVETYTGQAIAVDVLANDSDADGDELTLTEVSAPAHGSAVIANGKVTYTPQAGYLGVEAFTYTIRDELDATAQATVTVSVLEIPPAVFEVTNDWTTGFNGNLKVTNPGGAVTSWTVEFDFEPNLTSVWNGKLDSHVGDHYVIKNESWNGAVAAGGQVSFGFTGSPGNVTTEPRNIKFNGKPIDGGNTPPVAKDDAATTGESHAVTIDVLANDTDADGDTLTLTTVTQPANGSVELKNGAIVYTPNAGYCGDDTFTYTITDGKASATAKVSVKVECGNRPPVARDDAATTKEGEAVTVDVLANDSDPDGDTLSVSNVMNGAGGATELKSGKVVYTPNAGFTGKDAFTYTIADGRGASATAKVTVEVKAAGGATVEVDFDVTSDWGSGFCGRITIKNTGSTTIDGWTLEFDYGRSITSIWSASLQSRAGDHYTIKNASWTGRIRAGGSVSFGFSGSPGNVDDEPTNFKFNGVPVGGGGGENRPPVARDDAAKTLEGKAVTVDALANDTDPDGDALTLASVAAPANGSAKVESGKAVYTPKAGFVGNDAFTYTVSDGKGKTATAKVTVTVDPASGEAPSVKFSVTSDWGGGYCGTITVTNNGKTTMDGWALEFDFAHHVTSPWSAELVSRTGDHHVIKNASWNGRLGPGGKVTFGFNGSPGNVRGGLTNVKVNGQPAKAVE